LSDCLFCKIIAGEIPSERVYEDDYVFAFWDITPIAPVHILIVPKIHIESVADLTTENSHLVSKCFEAVVEIAKNEGLVNGFRVLTNSGPDGRQTIFHLHFHLLGGKKLNIGA
jgi:histidine triad (HIT) family protein